MKHTITENQLTEWIEKERVLFASTSGNTGLKRLYVRLDGFFDIELNGIVKHSTSIESTAVEMYNQL